MFKIKLSRFYQVSIIALILAVVLFDQSTKVWVKKGGFFNWSDFFDLGYYINYGTAFGIPVPYVLLFPLIFISLGLIIWKYFRFVREGYMWAYLALFMIVGGALSNVADRINYGFVIDYIHFWFGSTFNLADCLIILGVGILIIKELKK